MISNRWKNRFACLCMGGALLMGIAACGQNSDSETTASSASASSAASGAVIQVEASDFSWKVSETTLKAGEPIHFQIDGKDGFHGFSIVGTDVSQPIKGGESKEIVWTPEKAGTYTIKCNQMCGSGHRTMETTITVT